MEFEIENGVLKNYKETEVVIPDTVTEIGTCAFRGCQSLRKIKISASVIEIGEFAFDATPVTIKCKSGSYAEQYAKEKEIKYELI